MLDEPPAGRVDPALGAYLDLWRLAAALAVAASHVGLSGLAAWAAAVPNGRDAVMVFFVLSGFLVARSARGRTLRGYAVARAARVYSCAVPALALAFGLGLVGAAWAPGSYPTYQWAEPWSYGSLALAFLGDAWGLSETAFGDVPWWSLNFEAWYYVLFGVLCFWSGARRVALAAAVAAVMGPKLWLLAPVWLAGVWLEGRLDRLHPPRTAARALALGTVAVYVASKVAGLDRWLWSLSPGDFAAIPLGNAGKFGSDWAVGALFAAHLVGWRRSGWTVGPRLARLARWGAGWTFTLYLVHFPLMALAAASGVADPASPPATAAVLGAVLLAAPLLAHVGEYRRGAWAAVLDRAWGAVSRLGGRVVRAAA